MGPAGATDRAIDTRTGGLHGLDGRRVVVAGDAGPGAGITSALAASGARVVVLSPDVVDTAPEPAGAIDRLVTSFGSPDEVAAGVAAAVGILGGVDQFVYSWYPPGLTRSSTFAELGEDEWAGTCEGTLQAAWWLVRALIGPIKASGGGSMVFVVPTVGLTGASEFVMLATVAEGLRVLAKGCGRCWGGAGVTVNTVATSPALWVDEDHRNRLLREISLSVPAMGGPGEPGDDLEPLVALLGDQGAHFLTAGTLVADGGLWMGL